MGETEPTHSQMTEAEHMSVTLSNLTMLRAFQGARRLAKRKRDPNWVFAMEMFGLGSTYAWALCKRLGIDPGSISAEPLPAPSLTQGVNPDA